MVEKRGVVMQLTLQLAEPSPELLFSLTDWTVEGESISRRSVPPDAAEDAILDLAARLRTLSSGPTTRSAPDMRG